MAKVDGSAARRFGQVLVLTGLFLVSFVLFVFLTFPYEVLKESLAAGISQSTGYVVQIGDMGPRLFPIGLKAEDIRVETQSGSATMKLKSLRVGVGLLPLVLGKVGVEVTAIQDQGKLEASADFGVFDLLGHKAVPRRITLAAKAFPLDDLVTFALGVAGNSPTANPMVAPLLTAIGFSGQLTGNADFNLDAKNPTQSTGQADLSLNKANLKLSHPSLGLPDQVFKKALIKAKVENGAVVIDKNSGFVSDELDLALNGKVTLKAQPSASLLDLKIQIKLDKGLKDKFGFLIDAVTGSATSEGQLTMQLRGPMEQPAFTTF